MSAGEFQAPDDAEAPVATASALGLVACPHCDAVWRGAAEGEPCGRCGTHLHTRKPYSLNRTWAFLIAACIMYIPANLLPVMITRTLFGAQYDTILSGVIYFWVSGAYGLAAIVFIASFLVPLFKLAVLFLLVVMAQRASTWRQLNHWTEFWCWKRCTLPMNSGTRGNCTCPKHRWEKKRSIWRFRWSKRSPGTGRQRSTTTSIANR